MEQYSIIKVLIIVSLLFFINMLPTLNKPYDREFKATDSKVYHNRDLSQQRAKRDNLYESGRYSVKAKVGGGFKISNTYEQATKNESLRQIQYAPQSAKIINYIHNQRKSPAGANEEIRTIEKKIRQCQKNIEREKKRKLQQQRKEQDYRYGQDFQDIIRKEMQLQGIQTNDLSKNFDYLTNPGGPPQQQEQLAPPAVIQEINQQPPYSIAQGIQKLERFYENSLKKKFERRQAFPHMACRRKTPKLYITQKTNALSKHGKPLTEEQHKFRVLTKQTTPQQIYPVIPNFAVVKDNLSKNIVAYLGDYKPFIDKTKEKVEKQIKKQQQQLVLQNASKSLTITN